MGWWRNSPRIPRGASGLPFDAGRGRVLPRSAAAVALRFSTANGSGHPWGDLSRFDANGWSEIRTHGTLLTYTRFPGVRLKPLGHPSSPAKSIPPPSHALPTGERATAGVHDGARLTSALLYHSACMPHAAPAAADRVRFELTIPLPVRRFSRPVPSTTQPPVLGRRSCHTSRHHSESLSS